MVPLLGWQFETLLAGLLVVVMAATLLLWPRVVGPRVLRGAQRVGMVLVCQVAAVLLVGAAVNNYGYFYGTWSDLFGTGSQQVVAAPQWPQGHFGRTMVVPAVTVAKPTPWSPASAATVRGKVESLRIHGARSGLTEDALIYLPPQYFQPAYAHHQFPAVEMLTGYPGVTASLVSRLHVPELYLAELTHHRAAPMVVVMLRPTVAPPRDTECTDVPAGPQALTYLSQDVPTAVDGLLRVRPLDWGAMGESTGGYCAVKEAMLHSDVFRAAVSLSGYYHTLEDPTTGNLWGGSQVLRNLNSPEWLLAHQPAPPVSVLASIGQAEGGLGGFSDLRRFLSLVRPPMTASSIIVPGGGHNYANWARVLPTGFDWLSARLHA
ncbi:esterase family protein [Nostocoides sp. HKS02]|uniref:alpha/beta hydrolase n=1 Tax=Nostocoides sp. HKS02 TaxID=1813880 RepID=UPI0012B48092|nr:alpha/beta hydrolase-fold protein [Tetrasphaera sp. HKS02]QGN57757.1 esterase [Tetrasphaera sp. HKS02]